MRIPINLIGQKFGKLTVIERDYSRKRRAYWICKCECGNTTVVASCDLRSGHTQSCGCKCFESHNAKHKMKHTRIYNIWCWMRRRCNDPKSKAYKYYGAEGKTVCHEWDEFLPFYHWAIFSMIGMKPTIVLNRARTIAHWLKENEPDTWNRTAKYVNISTYLTYKLTGNLVDSVASIVGHYPINFKQRKWYNVNHLKARIFGIPQRMLCELKQPGEVLGVISDEVAAEVGLPSGIKLFATGSDKACETIGLGEIGRAHV